MLTGTESGHYTAYVKNPQTSEWYYYNDEEVIKKKPDLDVYNSAYILFYEKQGMIIIMSVY